MDIKKDQPDNNFWKNYFDKAIQRAINNNKEYNGSSYANEKILRHRLLGHINENALEDKLRFLGETDMIHTTPTFGKIFWLFLNTIYQ